VRVYGGCSKSDHSLVSLTGAHLNPDDKVEIGYWVGAEFHGAGYSFEAANAMLLENQMFAHLLNIVGSNKLGLMGLGCKLFNYSRRA
jgi:RimJ/RimL family protein N-acetyltransferase